MSKVPFPVVVVTTAKRKPDGLLFKRGITCGSFTGVSLNPPLISFCMNKPSRMHDLILEKEYFAVHILSSDQVKYGVHFSQPTDDQKDQFLNTPHYISDKDLPVLEDVNAVLLCKAHSVHNIGDHYVWYGEVEDCHNTKQKQPLLYYSRSYRTVSDDMFMKAFEDKTLPFEDWTHIAHIRMAWNYIRIHGHYKAVPIIIKGIKNYNEENKDKISRGYHETVTQFFIHMITDALYRCDSDNSTFEQFLDHNKYLLDSGLLYQFYSKEIIDSKQAAERYLPPDKKMLPSLETG
ncbi:NADH-dependent FAD reductase-like isoform X2 [Tubulanus polymorphus]